MYNYSDENKQGKNVHSPKLVINHFYTLKDLFRIKTEIL